MAHKVFVSMNHVFEFRQKTNHKRIKSKMNSKTKRMMFQFLFEREQGKCFWCERSVIHYNDPSGKHKPDQSTLDHLITKTEGGGNTKKNLVLSCYHCNHKRGDTPLKTWIKKLNFDDIKVERIRNPLSLR